MAILNRTLELFSTHVGIKKPHVRKKKGIGYRPARLIRFQSRGTFVVGGGGVVQVKVQSCFKRRKPNKSCPTSEVFWGRALLAVD